MCDVMCYGKWKEVQVFMHNKNEFRNLNFKNFMDLEVSDLPLAEVPWKKLELDKDHPWKTILTLS